MSSNIIFEFSGVCFCGMQSSVSGLVNIGELFSHYFFDQFGYETEVGHRSVIFEEISVKVRFLETYIQF